jgi:hypothetical protein
MIPGLIIGGIGIALAIAFALVPPKVSKDITQAGLALGVLLAAVGLGLLTVQVRELRVAVRHLAAHYTAPSAASIPPSATAAPESLKEIGDQPLRSRVATLAHAMCDFEHKFQSDELDRKLTLPPMAGNPEQMERQWQMEATMWQRRYDGYQNDFRKQFLPAALAYRGELLRRLQTMPADQERQIPALHGNLTGASPVCDLGVYLESLAIQLAP